MKNTKPETGGFFQRDRLWHPPAFAPGYKSTVVRSPQRAPIAFPIRCRKSRVRYSGRACWVSSITI